MHWRIQDFPDEGRASSHEFGAKTCYLVRFSVENCHENERNWIDNDNDNDNGGRNLPLTTEEAEENLNALFTQACRF